MARPLRIEFAATLTRVTSRGDRREDICVDDADRRSFVQEERYPLALSRYVVWALRACSTAHPDFDTLSLTVR